MSKTWRNTIAVLLVLVLWATGGVVAYTMLTAETETVGAISTAETKQVQQKLKYYGFYKYPDITGYYGPITTQAMKDFQKAWGLPVTGQPDASSLKALGISTGYTSNDVYLLAKCVYAEARGEPYTGQVAVAAVILNRVKNPQFPNSIYGVIYQPLAFTAVADGQINLEPNQTAYQAAQDALNGWDPTYGSLYYFNPVTATSKWIWSRKQILTIGKHIFCL